MKYVLTGSEMQDIDRLGIEKYKVPSIVLMENAASQAFNIINNKYKIHKKNFLIFAGGGNNGGDGLAISRYLFLHGAKVKVIGLFNPKKARGDLLANLNMAKNFGVPIYYLKNKLSLESLIKDSDIIIDAIFGTGLSRNIEGKFYNIIEEINRSNKEIISIDIPSGIDSKTGEVKNISIQSNITLTFEYLKRGHLLYPGRSMYEEIYTLPISLPKNAFKTKQIRCFTMDKSNASKLIKNRPKKSNKGDYGKIAIIAGSRGMAGAAYMTSQAAKRSGNGLSTLLVPRSIQDSLATKLTETMTYGLGDECQDIFYNKDLPQCLEILNNKNICIIGPGIGQDNQTCKFLFNLLNKINLPLVLDADALNIISKDLNLLKNYQNHKVLTPHPGEMSRLVNKPIDEIIKDPIGESLSLSKDTNSIVVLKDSTTIVTNPKGDIYLNTTGNPGMASGGSGDVLTGMIGSLIGQNYDPFIASILSVYIHGLAGDLATIEFGQEGLIASDIIDYIPKAFLNIKNKK